MTRVLLLIISMVFSLYGAPWREMKSFHLKKDEIGKVLIKTSSPKMERVLQWRWTLYTDKALIVHEKYDRIVGQHVLSLGRNDSFRKRLLNANRNENDVPYAVVVFKKFDDINKSAQFDLLIIDKETRILVDYLGKEEKK
ncbi:MAG: hypothetical protein PHW18_04545 [Sulfuricurvum sp.]|uniref:hypothetical protein n=1 Tax=Sulfuricurvum sp. TaxID=2025608 RepID=UPI0026070C94|nr:hypothetical protein [Sulfuricurvum sp.]MDD2828824.1 hypothetical protein [Sulfuricurvum sp.]MDD4948717.1 hypothetical protein [Sulfuricurvum sp.]